jgi:hypothetical protein
MIRKTTQHTILPTAILCLICLVGSGWTQEYKDYKSSNSRTLLYELEFDKDNFGYSVIQGETTDRFTFGRSMIVVSGRKVTGDGQLIFDSEGFHAGGEVYSYDMITDLRVRRANGSTTIGVYTRSGDSPRVSRIRRGNIISPFSKVLVGEEEFVRGAVFSVTDDIEVYGEVTKDVVTLFGDLFVGPDAVVRGDIATVSGRIDLAGDAAVYGDIHSGIDSRLGRRHRYHRFRHEWTYNIEFSLDGETTTSYNRVDGLALGLTARYLDPDSALPRVWAGGGYAFESARWRYDLGLEQSIIRDPALAIGGSAFRVLATDDDWLLSTEENSAFAILFRQDYRDYYEAEGSRAYLKSKPFRDFLVETGFHYEETKWLEAERDLWSLFGGGKFDYNFGSVDSTLRSSGSEEIDTGTNVSLYASVLWDTRDEDDLYYYSSWTIAGMWEHTGPDLDSDFDYTRYRLSVTRHQRLNRRIMAIMRGVYGGSEGYLPMHRRFYLGGLGTLYGYEHKEFSGSRFWLANLEYRIDFPHSDLAASLMWDVGQISPGTNFDDAEVKNSLGAALYIGNKFKVGLARRLDRSYDNDIEFFARFDYSL